MDELIDVLRDNGLNCLRLSFHEGAPTRWAKPDAVIDRWVETLRAGHRELSELDESLPIFNLSYSLGALISIYAIRSEPVCRFERMVLLAPPVALTPLARLVRLLVPLSRFGLGLPSAAPADVRARSTTPLSEYGALLRMVRVVGAPNASGALATLPTRIFIDKDDELVSSRGVVDWQQRLGLDAWTVNVLRNRRPESRTYSHLIVTRRALGASTWQSMTSEMVAHFS